MCDRVAIISGGRLVAEGAPHELTRARGVEIETATGRHVYAEATREDAPRLVADLVQKGESIYEVRLLRTTLEESYLEVVEETDE